MPTSNAKKKFDELFITKYTNATRSYDASDATIIGLSSLLGFFSSWFAFKKTAASGASLVTLPWSVSKLDKETNAFIGGFVLNAILNAYFANDCIQHFKNKKFETATKTQALIIVNTVISTIPFIATTLINKDPLYSALIELAAYFFIHYKGASFVVETSLEKLRYITNCKSKPKNAQSLALLDPTTIQNEILSLLQNKQQSLLSLFSKKGTTALSEKGIDKLSDLDSWVSVLQSIDNQQPRAECSLWSKTLFRYLANIVNTSLMSCALIGYALLTIEKCFNILPLGILAFIPFAGITLYVIDKVDGNIVDIASRRQVPYYLQPIQNIALLAITALISAYYGVFSGATSLYLTERYIGNTTLYNDYNDIVITPATETATTIFNTYPTILIFSSVIMKKLATLTNKEILKMSKIETKFESFRETIKNISNIEELSQIKDRLQQSNGLEDGLPPLTNNTL